MKKKLSLLLFTALPFLCATSIQAQELSVWSQDIHTKIFADSEPNADGAALNLSAASNEFESGQLGLRSDADLNSLEIIPSELKCENNGQTIEAKNVRVRRIGMLPVTKNTPNADAIVVRKAPCDIPDILYDENVVSLKANETLGVWITAFVPKGVPAGEYKGTIVVKNESVSKEFPVVLNVFPFELPDKRNLYMTNWWSSWNFATYHKVPYMSEEYWTLLEKYFKDMGEHRQNVILIPWAPAVNAFVQAVQKEDGSLTFDFTNFERVLKLAEKYGVADRIELSHMGGIDREKHVVRFNSTTIVNEKGENVQLTIDQWLEPSLKALCNYLRETGRLEKAMIHVSDEPYLPDIDSWREASERVRKIAPDLKQIDAIETMNFTDRLDVWVPKLSHFDRWRKGFEERRANNEYWYYICCHPVGVAYPNRFMDLPGARVRVLHWINYSEDLVGYLHWGYNYWQNDAFGAPTETYGPGDTHIVYPGKDGPLDSVRWEIERESAEDYEYLKLLENSVAAFKANLDQDKAWAIDPKGRAMELARKIVPDLAHTTMDPELIKQTRRQLADEIVCATSDPKLIVQTFPEDGKTIYSGPNLVELYGVTTPGAKVVINEQEIPVDKNGFFKKLFYADVKGEFNVNVSAELNQKTVKTTRSFTIE